MLQGNIGVEQLTLSNESVPSFFNSHCYPISEASPTYDFLPFLVAQLLQVSSATQVLGFQSKSLSLKRRKLYKKMIYCPIVNNHIDFLHKILDYFQQSMDSLKNLILSATFFYLQAIFSKAFVASKKQTSPSHPKKTNIRLTSIREPIVHEGWTLGVDMAPLETDLPDSPTFIHFPLP